MVGGILSGLRETFKHNNGDNASQNAEDLSHLPLELDMRNVKENRVDDIENC